MGDEFRPGRSPATRKMSSSRSSGITPRPYRSANGTWNQQGPISSNPWMFRPAVRAKHRNRVASPQLPLSRAAHFE